MVLPCHLCSTTKGLVEFPSHIRRLSFAFKREAMASSSYFAQFVDFEKMKSFAPFAEYYAIHLKQSSWRSLIAVLANKAAVTPYTASDFSMHIHLVSTDAHQLQVINEVLQELTHVQRHIDEHISEPASMKERNTRLYNLAFEIGEEGNGAGNDLQDGCPSSLLACLKTHLISGLEVDYAHAELASLPSCGDTYSLRDSVCSSHSPPESCRPSVAAATRVCQTSRITPCDAIQKPLAAPIDLIPNDPEPTPDSSGGDRDPVSVL